MRPGPARALGRGEDVGTVSGYFTASAAADADSRVKSLKYSDNPERARRLLGSWTGRSSTSRGAGLARRARHFQPREDIECQADVCNNCC